MNFKHKTLKKVIIAISVIILLSMMIGYYPAITCTVVDADTGKPIEDAVVLAEWTITKGFGFTYTESYKVVEALSNKEGKVTISGAFNPIANKPQVTVYKKGYVAWNNEYVFPNYKKRTDFKWKNGYVLKLERFNPEYSHVKHVDFIRSTYSFGLGANSAFEKAWDWEDSFASEELKKK